MPFYLYPILSYFTEESNIKNPSYYITFLPLKNSPSDLGRGVSLQMLETEVSVIGAVEGHFGDEPAPFDEFGERNALIGGIVRHIDDLLYADIVDEYAEIDVNVLRDEGGERLGGIPEHVGDLFQPQIAVGIVIVDVLHDVDDIVSAAGMFDVLA